MHCAKGALILTWRGQWDKGRRVGWQKGEMRARLIGVHVGPELVTSLVTEA